MSSVSFHITRSNILPPLPPFSESLDLSPIKSQSSALSGAVDPLSALKRKVHVFLQEQQHILNCINRTPNLKTLEELNQSPSPAQPTEDSPIPKSFEDIKTTMLQTHTIPLTEDTFSSILEIWQFLKTKDAVTTHLSTDPQRFKITGLCSITLFKNTLIIHLKKTTTRCVLGSGQSIATRAINITPDNVSLLAELTTTMTPYRDISSLPPEIDEISEKRNFITLPLTNLVYTGHREKQDTVKQSRSFPQYTTDFFSILSYHEKQPIFNLESQWKMACFCIKSIEFLHKKHLVFRDLKPENFLISPSAASDGTIDYNNCTFALCDFELLTHESKISTDPLDPWYGTSICWPKNRVSFQETQIQPSDIYALAMVFETIFPYKDPNPDISFIYKLIKSMKLDDPSRRPGIDIILFKVRRHLKANHPEYPWQTQLVLPD